MADSNDANPAPNSKPSSAPKSSSAGSRASTISWRWLWLAAIGVIGVCAWAYHLHQPVAVKLQATIGDLQPIHAGVLSAAAPVLSDTRIVDGQAIETDGDGRARLRLDSGALAVLDENTRLTAQTEQLRLEQGRVFVLAPEGVEGKLQLGQAQVKLTGGSSGISLKEGVASVFAAKGELSVTLDGKDHRVQVGETAKIESGKVSVAPERAFDDWTEGLASPWASPLAPGRALGELTADGQAMIVRAHDVQAQVLGEMATTRVKTTYFNGGTTTQTSSYRVAIPRGAMVSHFAVSSVAGAAEVVPVYRSASNYEQESGILEWAGDGWLRATLPAVLSGKTVDVEFEYVEWLDPVDLPDAERRLQYRYPMVSSEEAPPIGELKVMVDAGPAKPTAIAPGMGLVPQGNKVQLTRGDVRPTADVVVDVQAPLPRDVARLYRASGGPKGDFVVIRSELPGEVKSENVAVSVVLDASSSMAGSRFETAKSFVRALISALGKNDTISVVSAADTVADVGPKAAQAADRAKVVAALDELTPGGATNLAEALEAGLDRLPKDAHAGLLLYVGDGLATVGTRQISEMHARLRRRTGALPRLGAVAIGRGAAHATLSVLTRGHGPLMQADDSQQAAAAVMDLMSEVLKPAVTGAEIEVGPELERVYPREPHSAHPQATLMIAGRLRGELPGQVTLRWHDAGGAHEVVRPVVEVPAGREDLVRRQWGTLRVAELVAAGQGREALLDTALSLQLITPWTSLSVASGKHDAPPLAARTLGQSGAFLAVERTPVWRGALLDGFAPAYADETSLEESVRSAAQETLRRSAPSLSTCWAADVSAAGPASVEVKVQVDGDGSSTKVEVSRAPGMIERCLQSIAKGLRYPVSGIRQPVWVSYTLKRYDPAQRKGCSGTSKLPLEMRRGVWNDWLNKRGHEADQLYAESKQLCELRTWNDRRVFLELVLARATPTQALELAQKLAEAGHADAAAFLEREALAQATTHEQLAELKDLLLAHERFARKDFLKEYDQAKNNQERLKVVRRYLVLTPHEPTLRRQLLRLLDAEGQVDQLLNEAQQIRLDPFADAQLIGEAIAALQHSKQDALAQSMLTELLERAPLDPWALAFAGDTARRYGWLASSKEIFDVLEQLLPDDASVGLRSGLVLWQDGRIDLAHRALTRIAQTGGRSGHSGLSRLAEGLSQLMLSEALGAKGVSADDKARVERALLTLRSPQRRVLTLVDVPPTLEGVKLEIRRGEGKTAEVVEPDLQVNGVGLFAFWNDIDGLSDAKLVVQRNAGLSPQAPLDVQLRTLVPDADGPPKVSRAQLALAVKGTTELQWNGNSWIGG